MLDTTCGNIQAQPLLPNLRLSIHVRAVCYKLFFLVYVEVPGVFIHAAVTVSSSGAIDMWLELCMLEDTVMPKRAGIHTPVSSKVVGV